MRGDVVISYPPECRYVFYTSDSQARFGGISIARSRSTTPVVVIRFLYTNEWNVKDTV